MALPCTASLVADGATAHRGLGNFEQAQRPALLEQSEAGTIG